MPGHDIIVIGASAGGVEALARLARDLPPDLPAAIFVVLHFPVNGTSVLPNILNRHGKLRAAHATQDEPIEHGRIYVAPPNHHLLVKRDRIRVMHGPRENGHRPAIDPLFRSAARSYGKRVVGTILSGTLDDGTMGLCVVKECGGVAVVQDPDDAFFSAMPRSAIENVAVDHILPLMEIGPALVRLAHDSVEEGDMMAELNGGIDGDLKRDPDVVEQRLSDLETGKLDGERSDYTCPECGGVMRELANRDMVRFRCHVGHAYSADSLLAHQSEYLEAALWAALRALEEQAALSRRLSERAQGRGHSRAASQFTEQALETEQRSHVIRQVLLKSAAMTSGVPAETDVMGQ